MSSRGKPKRRSTDADAKLAWLAADGTPQSLTGRRALLAHEILRLLSGRFAYLEQSVDAGTLYVHFVVRNGGLVDVKAVLENKSDSGKWSERMEDSESPPTEPRLSPLDEAIRTARGRV